MIETPIISSIFSPLASFEERIVTQAAVCSCTFIEPRPPRLHQGLVLCFELSLLLFCLNQDNLEAVEFLDEGQSFLELSFTLGDLKGPLQQLQRTVALDILLSRTERLIRVQQRHRLRKRKQKHQRKTGFICFIYKGISSQISHLPPCCSSGPAHNHI